MSVIDDNLLKGESIVLRAKYHKAVLFAKPCIVLAGTAFLYLFLRGSMPPVLGVVGLVATVVTFVGALLSYLSFEAFLTNKRVLTKTGIFSTNCNEILLTKVEAIDVQRDPLGNLLDYGNIKITGTGGSKTAINRIPAPFAFRKRLQEQVADSQAQRVAV